MYKRYFKRIFDLILTLIFMPLIFPLIVICAMFIILEDRGPAFYVSKRIGKGGQVFKMFKLRSMKVNSPDIKNEDGSTYNSVDDPRMTKVGRLIRKTSLDELPQFFNVLIGNMSLIGPRPDLPEDINYYTHDEIRRLDVLPGISGYNQAYFRNTVGVRDKLINDIYYVDNISFQLDLKIFLKTIVSIIFQRGVFSSCKPENEIKISIQ